jgi:peptidoglycan/LPS O-acetylase OafA/YrhL
MPASVTPDAVTSGLWPYAGRVPTDETSRRTRGPAIATAVVVAQGLALVAFGAWLMVARSGDTPSNESVYQGSTAYMFVTGALVLLVAVAARRGVGWAMSAAVFVQLLALAVTYEMAKEGFWAGAVPLGLASVVALLSLLSPSGRAAFGRS